MMLSLSEMSIIGTSFGSFEKNQAASFTEKAYMDS